MIEQQPTSPPGPCANVVAGWLRELGQLRSALSDAERVELIAALEGLKAATAAAQARLSVELDASQRQVQADAGVPARRLGEGVAAQVALARRESPVRGAQHLGLAKALVHELPGTLAAMSAGRLGEWQATLIARETACLSRPDRAIVDEHLTRDPRTLEGLGDRALVGEVRRLAYRIDPASVVARRRRAEADRHVSLRPAPDAMTYLTALLPVAQGVAAYAALRREGDRTRDVGDPRGRGQAMADALVARVTGHETPDQVPLTVNLVMTDRALLRGEDEPAEIEGYGVVPADWARDLVTGDAVTTTAPRTRWIRRLYTAPTTGDLVALDSRRRLAPRGLADFIRLRDRTCRTPWCDAPIRHTDHVVDHRLQGPTTAANLDGLCERCNHAKQAPGWHARARPGPRHTIELTTPTGHTHRATAPPLPGAPLTAPPGPTRAELYTSGLLLIA